MGSAVQRSFLKINDAVLEGGDTLASFAETAGMSSSEFQKAWQDDAAQALIPFLEGLHETHEAGGNVNSILRDLGITSVNELNTLLVLAGGYDQLAGNLEMASAAYNETEESMMALNKEAELAYGTTLGKLRTAWNRLKDSLIDIGEPIADAVLDMVDAAEPLFETIENIATGFSNLDESAQRDIISTVGKIALIAPALKIAGGAMTTLGDIFTIGGAVTRKAGEVITKAMFGVAGEAEVLTTVAGTAAGSQGVGGLIASLAGSAGLPWALGIAAVALGGWTLWKTWGEDAWEAGQRTKRWGTDVGEAVDDALGSVQKNSQTATGMFALMQQGVETDSAAMIGNFETMGLVIENSLVERISMLDELIEGLPSTLEKTLGEVLEEDKQMMEESLEEVQMYNERITSIREKAANENREISVLEAKQIQELTLASSEEYVKTLGLTQEEQRTLLDAMTGDVESASKEQATAMAQTLAEQRQTLIQDRTERRNAFEEDLRETGLYSDARVEELMSMWDRGNQATTNGIDEQLRIISEKYPEIAEEVFFANGQMIRAGDESASAMIAANKRIVDDAYEMSATLEYQAIQNAERMQWLGDEATEMGRVWNDLILDEKGMLVESNAREAVIEASADIDTWNSHIRPQLKRADLHSNAKLIIGEAAIAHGRWEGMAYEDKMAVLEDNFSVTLYEALEGTEVWNNIITERKSAVLRNEFGQTVAEAIVAVGEWDELDPLTQQAILTTNTPETLIQVLKDIEEWETLPIEIRDLLVDSTDVEQKTASAKRLLDEYGNIIVDKPTLEAHNNAQEGVSAAQRVINSLQGKVVTLRTRRISEYITVGSPSGHNITPLSNARGTGFHPGGMAMVNDQKGATFRELVTLPDGSSFVPSGRNVLLDLPKGSKVLRAALTKMKFPDIKQYKDGVGYSRQQTQQIMANNNTDMSQTNNLLTTLIDMVRNGQVIQMDGNEVGRTVYPTIDNAMTTNMQRSQVMNM